MSDEKNPEIIEQLECWKDIRIRLAHLLAGLKSVDRNRLSRLYEDKESGYRALENLFKALQTLERNAKQIPLRILAKESREIAYRLKTIRESCEALGMTVPEED